MGRSSKSETADAGGASVTAWAATVIDPWAQDNRRAVSPRSGPAARAHAWPARAGPALADRRQRRADRVGRPRRASAVERRVPQARRTSARPPLARPRHRHASSAAWRGLEPRRQPRDPSTPSAPRIAPTPPLGERGPDARHIRQRRLVGRADSGPRRGAPRAPERRRPTGHARRTSGRAGERVGARRRGLEWARAPCWRQRSHPAHRPRPLAEISEQRRPAASAAPSIRLAPPRCAASARSRRSSTRAQSTGPRSGRSSCRSRSADARTLRGYARAAPHPPARCARAGARGGKVTSSWRRWSVGVARAPEQHAAGELAIPPGAARLLVVGLGCGGQGPVDHEADLRLVDAHAERAGGDDHVEPIVEKVLEGAATAARGVRPAWYGAARCPACDSARATASVTLRVGA